MFDQPDPANADPAGDEDAIVGVLCPNCALSNEVAADFCRRCGAPLSMMATIDPLKCSFAEGFAYRQATSGPPKTIIVVGMWLIFLPGLVGLPIKLASGPVPILEVAPPALYFILSVVILYNVTMNFVRKRREQTLPQPDL